MASVGVDIGRRLTRHAFALRGCGAVRLGVPPAPRRRALLLHAGRRARRPGAGSGCGTGRLMAPLLRAGHTVVGVDAAPAMLARAAARIGRLPGPGAPAGAAGARGHARARVPAPVRVRGGCVSQHPAPRQRRRSCRRLLRRHGARADPRRLAGVRHVRPRRALPRRANARPRDRRRRWGATRFRHPATGRRIAYSESYRLAGRILHMTLHYQPSTGATARWVARDVCCCPTVSSNLARSKSSSPRRA